MTTKKNDGSFKLYSQIIQIKKQAIADLQREIAEIERLSGGADGKPRPTALYMAEVVLRKAGKPMHCKDIAAAIAVEFDYPIRIDTLGTRLHRAAVERGKFSPKLKTAPNTYALIEK